MPSTGQYLKFGLVNAGFVAQIAVLVYFRSILDIKANWPLYRCNPTYWVFSDNVAQDFAYCVQNTQTNMMGYLLQPLNYMIGSITSVGGGLSDSINEMRTMFSNVRGFVSDIIENVFGVFLNLIIEFQKMVISIKDMVGKMIGIVVTIMYVLDGSIKTMNSAWSGPPGQMVKSIGSCFHPRTELELADGRRCAMEDAPLGAALRGGGNVFAVLKIDNPKREPVFQIEGTAIFVTGDHFVFDRERRNWVRVRHYSKARKTDMVLDSFSCLITTNRHICLDDEWFWDWEDDECVSSGTNLQPPFTTHVTQRPQRPSSSCKPI